MMEYAFIALCLIAFIAVVQAYILGCKHGLSMSKGRIPQPLKDVVAGLKTPVEVNDPMEVILGYDYDSALKAVQKEHLEGRK
jgi:hypothetical protein